MLTIKSSRSRIVLPAPSGWNPLSRLNPNTHGSESRIITTRFTATALPLEHPVRSIANEMIFSNTAIIVDAAAKSIQRKKILPQILPPAIELNIFGNVIKIRFGPLSGFTPKAKHAGKIINPESSATHVSRTVTHTASPVRLLERSM